MVFNMDGMDITVLEHVCHVIKGRTRVEVAAEWRQCWRTRAAIDPLTVTSKALDPVAKL